MPMNFLLEIRQKITMNILEQRRNNRGYSGRSALHQSLKPIIVGRVREVSFTEHL